MSRPKGITATHSGVSNLTADRLVSVIDDDPSLRRAIVVLVRSLGYSAQGFASAEEFLAIYGGSQWGCIITDIQMPGMSGIELKETLDRLGILTPVVLITARTESQLLDRALASGAIGLLRKPFDEGALVEFLGKAFSST